MKYPLRIKIAATGYYLPQTKISSRSLEQRLGVSSGEIHKSSGVKTRYWADQSTGETASGMAAEAAKMALQRAGYRADSLDLILYASASPEQGIPDTAPLIQYKLGLGASGISCFSVDSTCLSFITALDIATCFVAMERYKRILIVSSELPSTSLQAKDLKTYGLFGDAAAAVIVERSSGNESSRFFKPYFATFGEASGLAQIIGCGTRKHPNHQATFDDNIFQMQGRSLMRYVLRKTPQVLENIWPDILTDPNSIDWVLPHQPSKVGLLAMKKYFPAEKIVETLTDYGNCVSASLPLTLHTAIEQGKLERGQRAILIGTGAGLSIGGVVFDY